MNTFNFNIPNNLERLVLNSQGEINAIINDGNVVGTQSDALISGFQSFSGSVGTIASAVRSTSGQVTLSLIHI